MLATTARRLRGGDTMARLVAAEGVGTHFPSPGIAAAHSPATRGS